MTRPALGVLYSKGTRGFLQETKWLAYEAGQSPPCSAEGVNAWSYTSSPHCMSQWHAQRQLYFDLYHQSLLIKCITKLFIHTPTYCGSYKCTYYMTMWQYT